METSFRPLLMGLVLFCFQVPTQAQEFREHISLEFTIQNANQAILAIHNINGSIKVQGYSGNKVLFEIDKTIFSENASILAAGKKEFAFEVEQVGDSIVAYISNPFDSRPNRNRNDNWDERKVKYQYKLDFVVKVPANMSLNVSTVNQGDVTVSGVTGAELKVHNVNGGITVNDAAGATFAGTVNGHILVNYTSNPDGASSYTTINGDIKVRYQPDLSANVQFKTMNGETYTDFLDAEILPGTVINYQRKEGAGTVYKIEKHSIIRIGKGGNLFKFETLNGNIYIKKQS